VDLQTKRLRPKPDVLREFKNRIRNPEPTLEMLWPRETDYVRDEPREKPE